MMMDPRTAVRGPTLGHGSFDPRAIVPARIANPGHDSKLPPPRGVPYPPSAAVARPPGAPQQQQPPQQQPEQNGPKDLMTVKDLMINVIERSLSTSVPGGQQQQQQQRAPQQSSSSQGAPVEQPTTIHQLLEHSADPALRFRGNNALPPQKTAMAPPRAVPANSGAPSSGDCETLDLSMPRRREVSPPPASSPHPSQVPGHYREPTGNQPRSSPSIGQPPPAHSSNKAKTNPDPYFRGAAERAPSAPSSASAVTYGPDGRPLSTSPHLGIHPSSRTAPSPGLVHAARPGPSHGGVPRPPTAATIMQYAPRMTGVAHAKPGAAPPSPKLNHPQQHPSRVLTIQTGSITQGTPVNQGASLSRYDPLMKVGAPEKSGSITHGTPYDKKHAQVINITEHGRYAAAAAAAAAQDNRATVAAANAAAAAAAVDHYRRTTSPGGYPYSNQGSAVAAAAAAAAVQSRSGSTAATSYTQEPHISSRQVIMNDYAMARGPEMQRRPDSREQRPVSPRSASRDLSPRPRPLDQRIVTDPRAALDPRRDPRAELRLVQDHRSDPNHRGDPRALISHDIRGDPRVTSDPRSIGLEHRSDPRVGLEHRGDPRAGLPDPRSMDPRLRDPDHRAAVAAATAAAAIDPRHAIDHRRTSSAAAAAAAAELRPDVRVIQDPRSIDFRNRSLSYYAQQPGAVAAPPQLPQGYITSDGKYVLPTGAAPAAVRSRSPPASHRIPTPNSTPPPPRTTSAATIIQRSVAPPAALGGGITSGRPIASKAGPPIPAAAAAALGAHRGEVEIYRTNPEVTISKTSSPRHLPGAGPPHDGGGHNPLTLLSDTSAQQSRLPERSRVAAAAAILPPAAVANLSRQEYERQLYERQRHQQPPATHAPTSSAASITSARVTEVYPGQQLAPQVSLEREKQKFLLQDMERVERQLGQSVVASTSSKPPPLAPTRTPPVAVPVGSSAAPPPPREEVRSLSAATLIDAIITKQITSGPPPENTSGPLPQSKKPFSRSPAELAGSTPQEDTAKMAAMQAAVNLQALQKAQQAAQQQNKTPPSRSPSLKGEPNGPDGLHAEHSNSAPGSRPVSRSGSTNNHLAEAENNSAAATTSKVPSPIPDGMTPEQYWKRRGYPPSSQAPGSSSSNSSMPAPRPVVTGLAPSPSTDERQITRVAQPISPKRPAAAVEQISPPGATKEGKPSGSTGPAPTSAGGAAAQPTQSQQQPPTTADGKPSLSALDYVKNKIVEEMKKSDGKAAAALKEAESSSATAASATSAQPSSATAAPPTTSAAGATPNTAPKRPHENHVPLSSSDGMSKNSDSPKKPKLDEASEKRPTVTAVAAPLNAPDSPGSEGEMVIDESAPAADSKSAPNANSGGKPNADVAKKPPPMFNSTPAAAADAAKMSLNSTSPSSSSKPPALPTKLPATATAPSKPNPPPKPTYDDLSD